MAADLSHSQSPRQDATARLLLLLSKCRLDPEAADHVRQLAPAVRNWQEFTDIACRKFIAPYASEHLSTHAADLVPQPVLEKLRQLARVSTMSVLRLQAIQARFHADCIVPTRARYAYIKGLALPVQFNEPIGPRFCRDIDILVSEDDFEPVIRKAMSAGYKVVLGFAPLEYAETKKDLDFVLKCTEVVTLFGEDGVPIEVHRRLDKTGLDFDINRAIDQSDTIRIGDVRVRTLPPDLHFVYVCYHHSRHLWSRLHWLADIDMMIVSGKFDPQTVLALADKIGIRPTIEAALEFHELSRKAFPDFTAANPSGGTQFLKACLLNLDGDLELEYELRRGRTLPDFMSAWQVSARRYRSIYLRSVLMRFRPTVTQYRRSRYPKQLFWVYSLQRAFTHLFKNNPDPDMSAHHH